MPPLLQLTGITKRFDRVEALLGVDFSLLPGEVHALLGENGAGKSTLMRVACGLIRADSGTITVDGTSVRLDTPADARRLGIGMVHQHFTSIPALTVLENVALTAGWDWRPRECRRRLDDLIDRTRLLVDSEAPAGELSAGLKQRLEILKALAGEARVLLLDEPSSVLSADDSSALRSLIGGFRAAGISTVLITHKLGEALETADRVTVLRRGRVVHSGLVSGESGESLARHMLGEAPTRAPMRTEAYPGPVRVAARGVSSPRLGSGGKGLIDATFSARAGEIVGLAAVEGNGQRELLRLVAGVAKPTTGSLEVATPVSFIPEDRTAEAIVPGFTVAQVLVLSQGQRAPWIRGPWVDWSRARSRAAELIAEFGIHAAEPDAPADSLSGGNQQRLLIAAALERSPAVLVAENPTRGLDVRATVEVLDRLRQAARTGVAVLVYLADLDALLQIADRLLVVANGAVVEVDRATERGAIGRLMLGQAAQ